MLNTDKTYGNFSPVAVAYTKVRRGYPQGVFDWLHEMILGGNPAVLDLGCGTGLSTRQLQADGFLVTGCDLSEQMIDEARLASQGIDYVVARAESLPFPDNHFDGVTAFTAFHWFDNSEALIEIYRILKNGGAFCVVHRRERNSFSRDYRQIMEKWVGKRLPSVYEDFNPEKSLRESIFKDVQVKEFTVEEIRDLDNYVDYFESTSLWNFLTDEQKPGVKQELYQHFSNLFPDKKVVRNLALTLVAGFKSE
jgi:ubiquinone/menaquinone biosynthesis C-methylase UbiE